MNPPLPFSATVSASLISNVEDFEQARLHLLEEFNLTYTNVLFASVLGAPELNIVDAGRLGHLPMEAGNALHVGLASVDDQVTHLAQKIILFTQVRNRL